MTYVFFGGETTCSDCLFFQSTARDRMAPKAPDAAISQQQLLDEQKRRQEEEKARLQKRRANATSRSDSNIEDDVAGAARHEMAAASVKRKAEEAAALAQQNAEESAKIASQRSRSDHDISDEAAGRARKEFAKASEKRREEEARERAKANAELSQRNANAGTRTDDNIDDEAAGIARKEKAAESRQRRELEAKEAAERSAFLSSLRANAGARTDSKLDTEAAALAREALAIESQRRKEAEEMRIKHDNYMHRKRLHEIQSKSNTDGKASSLFDSSENSLLERETDVWRASFLKFEIEQEHKEVGRQQRDESVFLQKQREENAKLWQAQGKAQAKERQQRQKRLKRLANEVRKRNRSKVRSVHEESAVLQAEKDARNQELRDAARLRVLQANDLDTRLDEAEAALQARERELGTKSRLDTQRAVEDTRSQILARNRLAMQEIRSARSGALSARSSCFSPGRGQDKRDAAKMWAQQRQMNEEDYLGEARANRAKAERQKIMTRNSLMALLKARRKHAVKERANDTLVKEERMRILTSNRKEVAVVYKRRFASREEVTKMWDASGGLIGDVPKESPRSEHSRSAASV